MPDLHLRELERSAALGDPRAKARLAQGAREAKKLRQKEKSVWNQVWNQVRSQVWNQVRSQVWNQVGNQVWYGSYDTHWLGFHQALGAIKATRKLIGLWATALATGWWFPYEETVIVTERPSQITENKIIYPSGWEVSRA